MFYLLTYLLTNYIDRGYPVDIMYIWIFKRLLIKSHTDDC